MRYVHNIIMFRETKQEIRFLDCKLVSSKQVKASSPRSFLTGFNKMLFSVIAWNSGACSDDGAPYPPYALLNDLNTSFFHRFV